MAVARTGKLTAVGAVIIGHHQEGRIRIDRLAVEGQVFNAFRLRVNGLALAVISRRLGDINLIIHAVDHVEVVGAEAVPVNQRLRLAAVRGSIWLNCPAEHSSHSFTSLPVALTTTSVFG